jgi:hypothetical protein
MGGIGEERGGYRELGEMGAEIFVKCIDISAELIHNKITGELYG